MSVNRQAECAGKSPLSSEIARQIAARMRRRQRGRIKAYRCPHCAAWHVGNR